VAETSALLVRNEARNVQQEIEMIEINAKPLSEYASRGWLRSMCESLRLEIGKFAKSTDYYHGQEHAEGDRMKPSPVMELAWIRGTLVVMGRNQTMKMLIQETFRAPRKRLFDLRLKSRPVETRNAHRQSR
jgi:hypothetical protein